MEDFLQRKRSSSSSIPAPPPTPTFSCDECDYIVKSERSLQTHKRQKHQIPQTDGGESSDDTTADTTKDTPEELTQEEFQKLKDAIKDWQSYL